MILHKITEIALRFRVKSRSQQVVGGMISYKARRKLEEAMMGNKVV